jgi:hypothetical protein
VLIKSRSEQRSVVRCSAVECSAVQISVGSACASFSKFLSLSVQSHTNNKVWNKLQKASEKRGCSAKALWEGKEREGDRGREIEGERDRRRER